MALVLVRAVIRREKLLKVLKDLQDSGFTGATVYEARGMGGEGGIVEVRNRLIDALVPRVVIEVAVDSESVDRVIKVIMSSAKTGEVGDGRIFLLPLIDSIRIRTGEHVI